MRLVKLKIGDYAIIAVVLAAALFVMLTFTGKASGGNLTAVIIQDNQIMHKISLKGLEKPLIIDIPGKYHETVAAENGRIRFQEADCPDKVCVNTGWLTRPGQIAACLPNATIIKIEGDDNEIDVLAK